MKNLFIIVLLATTCALGWICCDQHLALNELRNNVVAAIEEAASASESAVSDNEISAVDLDSPVDDELALAVEELDEMVGDEPEVTDDRKDGEDKAVSMLSGLAEAIDTPGMKEMIKAQQKATMDITYASLYKYLSLTPEEMDAFKGLLVERQMSLMDMGLSMLKTGSDTETQKTMSEQIVSMTDEYNERIKDLLGEEQYQVFSEYEQTQPERMQVTMFKQGLSGDSQISSEQEHELIVAMHEERTNYDFSNNYEDNSTMDPELFTEQAIAQHISELAGLQKRYMERAASILTPDQLKGFEASQVQQQAMQEFGLKIAGQMFSKKAE